MSSWAWEFYLERLLCDQGVSDQSKQTNECVIFTNDHKPTRSVNYGVENLSDSWKKVKIEMLGHWTTPDNKQSPNYVLLTSPQNFICEKWVEPHSIAYLGSSMADPDLDASIASVMFDFKILLTKTKEEHEEIEEESSEEEKEESKSSAD